MKKIVLFTLLFIFSCNLVSFAAVSGSKARRATPPSKPPTTQSAPANSPANNDYKPSTPAKNLNEKAPEAKQSAAPAINQQSNTGGFLRNMGMFGSGMLLGGMLGSMFGFGPTGMFAQLVDMMITLLVFAGVLLIGRTLWNKLKSKRNM